MWQLTDWELEKQAWEYGRPRKAAATTTTTKFIPEVQSNKNVALDVRAIHPAESSHHGISKIKAIANPVADAYLTGICKAPAYKFCSLLIASPSPEFKTQVETSF